MELKKILYVDDDIDIRRMAEISLIRLGNFEAEFCDSGYEALEKLKNYNPQLIILDVLMPNMDGVETLKKIKTIPECSNIPIIFLTGKVESEQLNYYKELGVIDIIEKPFDPVKLPENIKKIWENI